MNYKTMGYENKELLGRCVSKSCTKIFELNTKLKWKIEFGHTTYQMYVYERVCVYRDDAISSQKKENIQATNQNIKANMLKTVSVLLIINKHPNSQLFQARYFILYCSMLTRHDTFGARCFSVSAVAGATAAIWYICIFCHVNIKRCNDIYKEMANGHCSTFKHYMQKLERAKK